MKTIRYILEAILLTFIMVLSKMLPAQTASNLGAWIGKTIGPRLAATRKATANIRASFPDKTESEVAELATEMWANLGRVMMEYAHIKHLAQNCTEIVGHEIIEEHKDTAVIFFSAHTANWEVSPPAAYLQFGFESISLYRAPNNPFTDVILNYTRQLGGKLKTIPKSKSGTRQIMKAIENKEHIGALIDQKYNEGIEVDFMGRPAMTSPIFAQLAQKFDLPLIPMLVERVGESNFRTTFHPPLDLKGKTTEAILEECHKIIEDHIKKQPAHWLWLHRRWDSKKLKEKQHAA